VLASDGSDLAAAIQTIIEIGDEEALQATIADAFDGASVEVDFSQPRFELRMHQPALLRPLSASELSDGTLRYLLLAAALLTPRPPPLMVLNEPETSLHPDLLPPLARLIGQAAKHTQIIVVSHANRLVAALEENACKRIEIEKSFGETIVIDQADTETPRWEWAER
jgi:predicted ATPase